jgi:molybdate transport system substrate-binding protein
MTIAAALCALLTFTGGRVEAGTTHVAVAANFTEPAKEIAALFKQKTGHEAVLIFGASGAFHSDYP